MLKHVTYRSTSSLSRASSSDFSNSCRASSLSPDTCSLKGDPHLPPTPDLSYKKQYVRSPERYYQRTPDSSPHYSERTPYKDYSDAKYFTRSYRTEGLTVGHRQDLDDLDGLPLSERGSFSQPSDAVSLSSLSLSSLTPRLSSRCSSTASLSGDGPTVPVKIYLRQLRPDIEYKTVSLSSSTTCRELIKSLLAKYRLRHRDPNLFFITMEVIVRSPGSAAPVKHIMVLDDSARPAELQQCRPRGEARFSIGVRRGGLLRVHDSILMPGSQYKSLMVSYRTTSEDLIQLLLNCYNSKESPKHFALHEVCKSPYNDRPISSDVYPLAIQSEWPKSNKVNYNFVLRRNLSYALSLKSRINWRRSLDQSSTDESEYDHEDHNTTSLSLMSGGSVSSARSSISSSSAMSEKSSMSSASTNSIGSSVSSTSATSAVSANSSSGVSSASSMTSTPNKNYSKTKLEVPSPNLKIYEAPSSPRILGLPPKPVPRTLFSVVNHTSKAISPIKSSTPPAPVKSSSVLSIASRSKSTSNLCNAIKSFTASTLNLTSKLNSDSVLKPTQSTEAILEAVEKKPYSSHTLESKHPLKTASSTDSILKSPHDFISSSKSIPDSTNKSTPKSSSSTPSTVTILAMIPKTPSKQNKSIPTHSTPNKNSPLNLSTPSSRHTSTNSTPTYSNHTTPTNHSSQSTPNSKISSNQSTPTNSKSFQSSPISHKSIQSTPTKYTSGVSPDIILSTPTKSSSSYSMKSSQESSIKASPSSKIETPSRESSQCIHSSCSHSYENCFYI